MPFNTLDFWVFFAGVWVVCHFGPTGWRNPVLLAASLYAYGCWNWHYLPLVILSALVDYALALRIGNSSAPATRKLWLGLSLAYNLAVLFFFKYAWLLFSLLHRVFPALQAPPLPRESPIGISFFTFQSMAYTFDVYRGRATAGGSLINYLVYVSFFPQMMAGPIERPSGLLRQLGIFRRATAEEFYCGLARAVWGLFQKLVIADNLGLSVSASFNQWERGSGMALAFGVFLFGAQLYADFNGYCDMALGLARMLGLRLAENFRAPYFARSAADFWRRWNRTLMSWFHDYVYRPLAGRGSRWRAAVAAFLVFILSGLWHGASWHFALWGLVNGLFLLVRRAYRAAGGDPPGWPLDWLLTVPLVWASLVFFRAPSISVGLAICRKIVTLAPGQDPTWVGLPWDGLFAFAGLVLLDWLKEPRNFEDWFRTLGSRTRIGLLVLWGMAILSMGAKAGVRFLYLQF